MKKIKYEQSSTSKQIFLILTIIYMILRLTIIFQIYYYKIPNYYENIHFPITISLYITAIAILIFLLFMFKLCYCLYDADKAIYINQLRSSKNIVKFGDVKYVRFDKYGVYFYSSLTDYQNNSKELFKIPFFRFGRIDPIDINDFYKMLQSKSDITVEKTYTILPGFGPRWKFVSYLYILLSVVVFMNYAQPIKVILVLFMNH